MPLYEVAIIENPKNKNDNEKLILAPVAVLATNEQTAAISAVLDNPACTKANRDRMQVLVRPFV